MGLSLPDSMASLIVSFSTLKLLVSPSERSFSTYLGGHPEPVFSYCANRILPGNFMDISVLWTDECKYFYVEGIMPLLK